MMTNSLSGCRLGRPESPRGAEIRNRRVRRPTAADLGTLFEQPVPLPAPRGLVAAGCSRPQLKDAVAHAVSAVRPI